MENEKEKIQSIWHETLQEDLRVKHELLQDFYKRKIELSSHRNELFKLIIQLSAGAIIAPYLFNLSNNQTYYFVGNITLLILIVFLVLKNREEIDSEFNGIQKFEDDTVIAMDRKREITENYLKRQKFSFVEYEKYWEEIKSDPEIKVIKAKNDKNIKFRKSRQILPLSYTGQLVSFLFLSGIFWITAAILPNKIDPFSIILGELLIFVISTFDSSTKIAEIYSKVVALLIIRSDKTPF